MVVQVFNSRDQQLHEKWHSKFKHLKTPQCMGNVTHINSAVSRKLKYLLNLTFMHLEALKHREPPSQCLNYVYQGKVQVMLEPLMCKR